ncbi:efflux RND transporter permease subunit [Pseudoalteromonas sp. L23]|uniref:efflux RND transporter permease subunit n=1 Tax=unclassified Pseudoalteromonas TaxID=194690 RepID=UPI001EEF98EE|nr:MULTISPECIES: efflux RND transporter permease subunit [unclassified Pseudoalteromonas]MCF7514643.1 efflux RND transporter permease subunit [Pseudoalteromonas sp. L7]MCF7526578.1 efflux RND transporter permease subunit [Pseudoalteromonas sp. L23]MCX2766288.1 efflux RND transporter permease subunit [Pseudoalteromonas sp. B530]
MSDIEKTSQRGIIAYFANNTVAANLLMVFILIMGFISYMTIQRQMFPNFEINYVTVSAVYPGASPQEIEEGILIKIEEALKDVTEIKKGVYRAARGSGSAQLEIYKDEDLTEVEDKIRSRVNSIATFPASMEPVQVQLIEFRQDVVNVALAGNLPLNALKPIAKEIEDELLEIPTISLVDRSTPNYEIGIEVDPDALRRYNLTISDVSSAIRRYSTNISAGQIRTESGIIAVRVENQMYRGNEFRNIPVKVGDNGAKIYLQDIAEIKDGLTEGEYYFHLNGENAVFLSVKATKDQNMIPIAKAVHKYIEEKNAKLPAGLRLEPIVDMTYYLNARLEMMKSNMLQGALLVAIMLTIFLRFKLALWVMIGLPVCFLGAFLFMPALGISINIVSLFAFIMVLGIVVDDAIVIGESAYSEIERKGHSVKNVVIGAKRVATPATFGVLTTIAVFAPMLFSSGPESAFFKSISGVIILCLVFSLIESKWILPAHIAHTKIKPLRPNSRRAAFNKKFFAFVNGPYRRFIQRCVDWRWTVLLTFVAMLVFSFSLVTSNLVRFIPFPKVPEDYPKIEITMNDNVSDEQTIAAMQSIELMVRNVDKEIAQEFGQGMVKDVYSWNQSRAKGSVLSTLVDEELRPFTAFELARRWREAMPEITAVKSIIVYDSVGDQSGGEGEFGYRLLGSDIETLNAAGRQLISMLQQQPGLFDISSSIDPASKEMQIALKPVAYELGLQLADVAIQVGNSFYGGEAQRVIRDGEEIKVMVRYPELDRKALASLKRTIITTPKGKEVMLGDVVEFTEKPGINYIRREDGFRTVYVYGSIDEELIEPDAVVKNIEENILPELLKQFPGVKTKLGGSVEERQAQTSEQILFFAAGMLMVYILLAVPLKSYAQPLIVMSVIPFSLVGALWGHLVFGLDMSTMSMFGLVAAAGVVINDSLVMTDYINQARAEGVKLKEAVIEAGCARFRAITLTSITTFAGVMPIIFETSLQARFVIPMAVSLGFAVLFATLITLVLVPALYIILTDMQGAGSRLKAKIRRKPKSGDNQLEKAEA